MGGAFLHKKSLLDQFKDDYAMTDPIKARRAERSWGNPIVRHKREKGIQDWAKSFAGKRHYRKLMRFNAMRSEAFNAKEFNKFYDKVIDALLDIYDEDTIKEIVDEYPFIERWDGNHYRTVDDAVADIKDWLDTTEQASAQKACGQHQEPKKFEDSLDDFDNRHRVSPSSKYITFSGLARGAVRDDVRRVLHKSGILDPQLGKPGDSVRFEFGVQNNLRSVRKALAALLELGERNTWYIKYSDGDSEHNRITMYSPDIPNDMWYAGDVDKIVSYIMPVKSEAQKSEARPTKQEAQIKELCKLCRNDKNVADSVFKALTKDYNTSLDPVLAGQYLMATWKSKLEELGGCDGWYDGFKKLYTAMGSDFVCSVLQDLKLGSSEIGCGACVTIVGNIYDKIVKRNESKKSESLDFGNPSFKPREYEGEHILYTLYGLDSDGDELDDIITSPKKSTVTHTIKELLPDYGRVYNGMHVVAILYDKNDRRLDSEVVWSTDQNESSGTDEDPYTVYFLDNKTGRVSKDGVYPTWRKAYAALGDGTVWDEGSSNNFVFHGNHLQQIYKYKKTGRTGKWSGNGYDVIFDREISEDPAEYIKGHFTATRYNSCRFNESKGANETIEYEKGHRNSRGEDAPWVIRNHKNGKILASFAKKADAEAHLERMQRYSKSESTTSDRIAAIKDAIANAARATGLADKIVLSATNVPKLFVDVYQGGIMGDGINWEVTGNLDVRRCDKQDVKRAWRVDSLEELEKSFESEFQQLKDGKFEQEPKSESLKKALHESRVKKLEKMGEAADTITSRDVQAAARSAWSSSGAKDFKLDIVRLGDHVIIYAKGPNGEDSIGIDWHVHIPSELNSYKTPHVEQFASWGGSEHEPERTYDAKDLDDLEDFLLDEFKALQETIDVGKEN